jgi:WD40 repeat protein
VFFRELKDKVITALALSPDNRHVAFAHSKAGRISIWDIAAAKEAFDLPGAGSVVRSVTFSPDASRLVSGGDDGKVRLWDMRTGQEVLSLEGHGARMGIVAFTLDGRRLIGCGNDGRVVVWDAGPPGR